MLKHSAQHINTKMKHDLLDRQIITQSTRHTQFNTIYSTDKL